MVKRIDRLTKKYNKNIHMQMKGEVEWVSYSSVCLNLNFKINSSVYKASSIVT